MVKSKENVGSTSRGGGVRTQAHMLTKSRFGARRDQPPMPENRYRYPTPLPVPLPPQREQKDLIIPKPKLGSLNRLDPFNFHFSLRHLISRQELSDQGYFDTCWAVGIEQLLRLNFLVCELKRIPIKYYHYDLAKSFFNDDSAYNSAADNAPDLPHLSPQCLVNCLPAIYQGLHLKKWHAEDEAYECAQDDALHMVKYRGMALEQNYEYVGFYDGFRAYESWAFIQDFFMVPLDWPDMRHYASVLNQRKFLLGTFAVGESFEHHRGTGIYHVDSTQVTGSHTALVIGAGKRGKREYFEIRNTFGRGFGYRGICKVDKDLFQVLEGITGPQITSLENYMNSGNANDDFVNLMAGPG